MQERETKQGNPSRAAICFCLRYALEPFHPCVPPPVSHAGAGATPLHGPWASPQTVQKPRLSGRDAAAGGEHGASAGATEGPAESCSPGGVWSHGPQPGGCPAWGAVESGRAGLPLLLWALRWAARLGCLVATRPQCCRVYEDVTQNSPPSPWVAAVWVTCGQALAGADCAAYSRQADDPHLGMVFPLPVQPAGLRRPPRSSE